MKLKLSKAEVLTSIKNILLVIAGTLVLSIGTALFILPFDIVSGGISGISIVLDKIIPFEFITLDVDTAELGLSTSYCHNTVPTIEDISISEKTTYGLECFVDMNVGVFVHRVCTVESSFIIFRSDNNTNAFQTSREFGYSGSVKTMKHDVTFCGFQDLDSFIRSVNNIQVLFDIFEEIM